MGSVPYAGGVTFRVWAPNASSVTVRGEFNGWGQTTMASEGTNGNWSVDVAGAVAGQQYKYFLNGSLWKQDPRSRRVVNSVGNSIIYNPAAFDWGTNVFTTPTRKDTVIYELHVGTFEGGTPPRTFDQAITRLDYLRDLGINSIKVMPINEFAGGLSWGYNPAHQFAIESDYGSADAFKRFVKAAHERGIGVMVDVVHNHYGPSDMDLWQFDGWSQNSLGGIYFYNDNRASTPWGTTRPDFGRAEVRQFIRDQIFMFLEEYRVDGFRWDSVFNILNTDAGANSQGQQLLADINNEMQLSYPSKLRIAEDNAFDYNVGFHSQWDVNYRWALYGQVVASSDSSRNMNTVAGLLDDWPSLNRVVFSEAHDYVGTLNNRTRLPTEITPSDPTSIWARKRALLAAGIVMTTPGIPMIFQGQEMNETLAFHDNVAMRWSLTNTYAGIVRAYTDLIHSRRNLRDGMQGLKGTGINVHHIDNTGKVVAYTRWDAGPGVDDVVVVANFSATLRTNNNYLIEFPTAGRWYSHFNGDSTLYQPDFNNIGPEFVDAAGSPPRAAVNMGMYSLQIFSKTAPSGPPPPPVISSVSYNPPIPSGCGPVTITFDAGEGPLQNAAQVYIHVGRNGWQDVITPSPAMTALGSNQWQYTYATPPDTHQINCVFHNGAGTWDNNNLQDWATIVNNCGPEPPGPPAQIVFATSPQTVGLGKTSDVVTVQLQDATGRLTTSEGITTINLLTSKSGTFRNSSNTATTVSLAISNGESAANFRYTSTLLGTHALMASNSALTAATQNLIVTAQVKDVFDQSSSFTVPSGISQITIEAWGGGGGPRNDGTTRRGGGGGGAYVRSTISAVPGNTHTVAAGQGGAVSHPGQTGNVGGNSFVMLGSQTNVLARGGAGGTNNGGAGGSATTSIGTVRFSGGNGGNRGSFGGGAGGGSAFTNATGNAGQNGLDNGAAGGTGTGQGGDGGANVFPGQPGIVPGGGGGARGSNGGNGGAGANGRVVITYDVPVTPWNLDSNNDGIPDGWYLQYGLDPNNSTIAVVDSDSDGFTNRQENLLGTNPVDPASTFAIINIELNPSNHPLITWRSVGGRTYRVDFSDDPAAGYNPAAIVTENAVATGVETTRSFLDDYTLTGSPPANGRRLYRVRLVTE